MRNQGNVPVSGKPGPKYTSSGEPTAAEQPLEEFAPKGGSPKMANRGSSKGLGDTSLKDPAGYGSEGVADSFDGPIPAKKGVSSSLKGGGSEDLRRVEVQGFKDPANQTPAS